MLPHPEAVEEQNNRDVNETPENSAGEKELNETSDQDNDNVSESGFDEESAMVAAEAGDGGDGLDVGALNDDVEDEYDNVMAQCMKFFHGYCMVIIFL